jgi:hypothetical protein
MSSTLMIKYVDDVSLVMSVRKSAVHSDLRNIKAEIDNIGLWSSNNSLTLNSSKTCGIIFSRGAFKDVYNMESLFDFVDFRKTVRFLGVLLDEDLGWKSHINFIVKKSAQRVYILRRLRSVTSENEFFDLLWHCSFIA